MVTIILFAPLLGAIICGFGWKFIGETAATVVATAFLFLAAVLSWVVFLGHDGDTLIVQLFRWIESGTLMADWSIRLDRLTAIMLIVVTTVSALVHLYSFGYMDHDPQFREGEIYKPRFFAYLSFFTFAMLALVTSDNLLQMFFGWEGVGLASYLLIGFYWRKPSAGAAAMKAFIVNRVGDFGFMLGILALFLLTDSINFTDVFAATPELAETQISFLWTDWNAANLIAFLLFIGAMGKSAQLGLHTWLPDAMEGPTPVSALIHAATMVTAGVFLVCRMSPLMEYADQAMAFVVVVGAATAFMAATVGLVQNDIKRVIAYSTMSQLGYMFVAAGLGAYSVAMFHLLTHAFFKAMLFLGAGSVIHAMHHEQDMRNYGGLRKKIPYTFWAMMIGTLAITGVGIPLTHIGFAGFLSKDAVIEVAFAGNTGAFWALVVAALFTSFYSWRLMFLTFYGKPRGDMHTHEHAHESPAVMTVPLAVLAVGSVLAGMVFYGPFFGSQEQVDRFMGVPVEPVAAPVEEGLVTEAPAHGEAPAGEAGALHVRAPQVPGQGAIFAGPENHIIHDAHEVPAWVKVSPFVAMLLGFLAAWVGYIARPSLPGQWAANLAPLHRFLFRKWYFDEIYDVLFVRPAKWLGRFLWKRGDGDVIDGSINGIAMGIVPMATRWLGRMQSGYVFTYAFAMVIGIVILITWTTIAAGN
ncbi:NADH-quinone oxidoreductase subunit L [Jannaschia rubra]|uniref:NADH-quinone oxidoreductase subunit L n=1 Tax=Jannaschia rubra TaxID=282197 RepID=A0A0M6XR12_9RHOB|nr:NADH-quinone oxidoreductase subunit L [Jannaschia rubra]CTQ33586.1 NADH-quinone oxidoreductase subunit L [Jannaschia rubra]SFG04419.1 NADH dehydrogenase subunit L [Jannaschia rubra]